MKPGPKPWNPTPWDERDLEDALPADIQVVLYRVNNWDTLRGEVERYREALVWVDTLFGHTVTRKFSGSDERELTHFGRMLRERCPELAKESNDA